MDACGAAFAVAPEPFEIAVDVGLDDADAVDVTLRY